MIRCNLSHPIILLLPTEYLYLYERTNPTIEMLQKKDFTIYLLY